MIYRQKYRLDTSTSTASASCLTRGVWHGGGGGGGCGLEFCSHRTESPRKLPPSPSALCPVSGFEHSVQDTRCGDKLQRVRNASRKPGPADSVQREGRTDGGTQQRTALSPAPLAPPRDQDPEEDPAGLREDLWPEGPRDPHREAQPQEAPPRPCPRAPACSDTRKPVPNP